MNFFILILLSLSTSSYSLPTEMNENLPQTSEQKFYEGPEINPEDEEEVKFRQEEERESTEELYPYEDFSLEEEMSHEEND